MLLTAGDRLLGRQLHGYGEFWPRMTPPTRSAPPGAARSCCAGLSRPTRPHPPPAVALLRHMRPCRHDETARPVTTIETWPAIAVALAEQGPRRPHRRFQLRHQAGQAGRLRVPEMANTNGASWSPDREDKRHDQAGPVEYGEPHCRPTTRRHSNGRDALHQACSVPYGDCPYHPCPVHGDAPTDRLKSCQRSIGQHPSRLFKYSSRNPATILVYHPAHGAGIPRESRWVEPRRQYRRASSGNPSGVR